MKGRKKFSICLMKHVANNFKLPRCYSHYNWALHFFFSALCLPFVSGATYNCSKYCCLVAVFYYFVFVNICANLQLESSCQFPALDIAVSCQTVSLVKCNINLGLLVYIYWSSCVMTVAKLTKKKQMKMMDKSLISLIDTN